MWQGQEQAPEKHSLSFPFLPVPAQDGSTWQNKQHSPDLLIPTLGAVSQAVTMSEEKVLRQRGRRKMYLGSGTFCFKLRLLIAVLASAKPDREREAHRGSGNGGKECNRLEQTQRKGKREGKQA